MAAGNIPDSVGHVLALTLAGLLLLPALVAAESGAIDGIVYDNQGRPGIGATIRLLNGQQVLGQTASHASGKFHLAATVPDHAVLQVRHDCCTRQNHNITPASSTAPLEIRLTTQKPAPPSGAVLVSASVHDTVYKKPVPGARVAIAVKDAETYAEYQTTSNALGQFFVEIPPGAGQLQVSKENHQTTWASLTFSQDIHLDVPLPAGHATLAGQVLDAAGRPTPNATVQVAHLAPCTDPACNATHAPSTDASYSHDPGDVVRANAQTSSANDGTWHTTIGPGRALISISRDGQGEQTVLALSPGQRVYLQTRMAPPVAAQAKVIGRIVVAPDANLTVAVLYETTNPSRAGLVQPDRNGEFSLRVPPGQVILKGYAAPNPSCGSECNVTVPGPMLWTVDASRADNVTIDPVNLFALAPEPKTPWTVQGWVRRAENEQTIPGARLLFIEEPSKKYGWAQTGTDGSYRITLTDSHYLVYATGNGFQKNGLTLGRASSSPAWLNVSLVNLPSAYPPAWTYLQLGESGVHATDATGAFPGAAAAQFATAELGEEAFEGGPGNLGNSDGRSVGVSSVGPLITMAILLVTITAMQRTSSTRDPDRNRNQTPKRRN